MDTSSNNIEIIVLFEEIPVSITPAIIPLEPAIIPLEHADVNSGVPDPIVAPIVNPNPIVAPIVNPTVNPTVKTQTPIKKEDAIDRLVNAIKIQQKRGVKEYHFRPALIDGVYCYFVIYFKYRILTVESINVKYRFSYNGRYSLVPYVLYHSKFTTIRKAVENVNKIYSTYKQKNGDIMSAENYNNMVLEEAVIPYSSSEVCCICFENTTDTTECGHYICFVCRDKCCIQEKLNCPICRKANTLNIYNNHMHLINNTDYAELNEIFINKLFPTVADRNYIVQYEEDEESEESEESETEEGEEEEEGEEREEREDSSLGSDSDTDSEYAQMQEMESIS